MPSAHRGDQQGDGSGLWANDQHDEDVDQKHFRHFTMASESRTLERTIISVTRMPQCKLQNYFRPQTTLPRLSAALCRTAVQGPEMDNKIKLLDINLSSIVCAAAAKLEKSTATTNSGPHTYTQECGYGCVYVCVCVFCQQQGVHNALSVHHCQHLTMTMDQSPSRANTHTHTDRMVVGQQTAVTTSQLLTPGQPDQRTSCR